MATKDELDKGRLIAGSTLARTQLENSIDIIFIFSNSAKSEERAKKYVDSQVGYVKAMKKANDWTSSSLEDKLSVIGPGVANVYDALNYFGHPNPGSLTYYKDRELYAGQLNITKQLNCMGAMIILVEAHMRGALTSISLADLDRISKKLGLQLTELELSD
jgi:hypothetical protein